MGAKKEYYNVIKEVYSNFFRFLRNKYYNFKDDFMKKYLYLLAFLILSVFVTCPTISYAHFNSAYLRSYDEFDHYNENWMSNIADDTKLSELSIPGTHDTMSNGPGGDIVQTQGLSLPEQLKVGIRYLDIRARAIDNVLTIHHGPVYLNKNFGDVLNYIKDFLNYHPSEMIIMRVKQEYSEVSNTEFKRIFNKYLNNDCYKNLFYSGEKKNPSLKEIRNKIVVMYDSFYPDIGINYHNSFIQDNYKLNTNWDLYSKWISIKDHLNKTNQDAGKEIFINYLSGSTGSFPYFVASGHSSPGSHAPRLATGLTHPGWSDTYPDFPRVDWFLGIATIAFEGTNILTADYIKEKSVSHTGIIVADFPGYGLIDKIIRANHSHQKYNAPIANGTYQIMTYLDNNKVVDLTGKDKGNQILLWENHGGSNQKWKFVYDPLEEAYQIFTVDNTRDILAWNRYLDSNQVFGTENLRYPEHYWLLDKVDGGYIIRSKADCNKVLDVDGYYPNQGTNIKINKLHSATSPQRFAQYFKVIPCD